MRAKQERFRGGIPERLERDKGGHPRWLSLEDGGEAGSKK
jgi:hypothetical protein